MTITVEAVYENGVLKPKQPLPYRERESLEITIQSKPGQTGVAAITAARQTHGMIPWNGDHESLQRILDESEDAE